MNRRHLLTGAALGVCLALLAYSLWTAPRCRPGDRSITIGDMLVAGCRP